MGKQQCPPALLSPRGLSLLAASLSSFSFFSLLWRFHTLSIRLSDSSASQPPLFKPIHFHPCFCEGFFFSSFFSFSDPPFHFVHLEAVIHLLS